MLNQWTFQSRMYNAARYVCTQPDMQVVQLVSFGCGTDAITTDELRDILEKGGKLYTQLKIDDISNLGAVKIRIRSLMAAMEARRLFIAQQEFDAVIDGQLAAGSGVGGGQPPLSARRSHCKRKEYPLWQN